MENVSDKWWFFENLKFKILKIKFDLGVGKNTKTKSAILHIRMCSEKTLKDIRWEQPIRVYIYD